MTTIAAKLSASAGEMARRARDIQAGHVAETRRVTAIWTVLSQPALRTAEAPVAAKPVARTDTAAPLPAGEPERDDRKAKKEKKARKKAKKSAKKALKKAAKAEKKAAKAASKTAAGK